MAAASTVVVTGMAVLVYVNGALYGQATRFRTSKKATVMTRGGIDQLEGNELVRGPVVITGTIGVVAVSGDGGPEAAGLIAPLPDLTQEQYVSISLRDRVSGKVLKQYDRAMVETEEWEHAVKEASRGTLSFVALSEIGPVRSRQAG